MKANDTIKRMYFAKYWGQNVFSDGKRQNIKVDANSINKNYYLSLRSISTITKEEAKAIIDVFDSVYFNYSFFELFYQILALSSVYNKKNSKNASLLTLDDEYKKGRMIELLINARIAVPAYDLSVNDMVELGWIKIKEL